MKDKRGAGTGGMRRGAHKSISLWAWGLAVLGFPGVHPAQVPNSSSILLNRTVKVASVPSACTTPDKVSPQASSVLQKLASHPAAQAYNTLGILYGRAGQFQCAIAAFEAALALDPDFAQAHYSLALALLENHEAVRAASELQTILRKEPHSYLAHNALGLALQSLKKDEAAENEFQTALKINAHFAPGYYYLSQLMISRKKYVAAAYYLKRALAIPPPPALAAQIKLTLAVAYSKQGNYLAAKPLLQDLTKQQPGNAEIHKDLGTVYAHLEDYPNAAVELKKVLEIDPHNDAALLLLAKALMDMSSVKDALPYATEYTRRKSDDPDGWEVLGKALRVVGPPEAAADALKRCLTLDPSSYEAHCDLASVLARMGRNDEAIAELEKAKKLKPNGTEALYQLARLLAKEKTQGKAASDNLEAFQKVKQDQDLHTLANVQINRGKEALSHDHASEAARAFREALRLIPNDAKTHFNLAVALNRLGDVAGEQVELEKALWLDPKLAEAHYQLGVEFMASGENSEARREFMAAIENQPAYAEAENNLGVLDGKTGRDAEAEEMFRRAAADNPQYAEAFLNWGLILANKGQFQVAIEKFKKAIQLKPDFADALTALGMAEGKVGNVKEAIIRFRQVVNLEPQSAFSHLNLGIALADQYDHRGAFREFTEAVRLAPNSPVAHYNLGRIDYDMEQRDKARDEFEIACRLQPNYPPALYLLALLERQVGHIERSAEIAQHLVKLEPDNSDAQYLLGQNLLRLGKTDQAIEHWETAVNANPENASALYNLARELRKTKRPEAKIYLDRVTEFQKERQLTDRVRQLGNFALDAANARNWPLAIEQSRQALQLCGNCAHSAQLHQNLGLIYCRKGDLKDGKSELELALKLKPNDAEAQEALKTISSLPAQSSPNESRASSVGSH